MGRISFRERRFTLDRDRRQTAARAAAQGPPAEPRPIVEARRIIETCEACAFPARGCERCPRCRRWTCDGCRRATDPAYAGRVCVACALDGRAELGPPADAPIAIPPKS